MDRDTLESNIRMKKKLVITNNLPGKTLRNLEGCRSLAAQPRSDRVNRSCRRRDVDVVARQDERLGFSRIHIDSVGDSPRRKE